MMLLSTAAVLGVTAFLEAAQAVAGPGQCGVLGLCGLLQPDPPVAPGVLFVAVGLVAFGVWGLRKRRQER
ncbi:MAG: hypothetical protein ABIR59_03560 [Gemmatimonadales bacterium]